MARFRDRTHAGKELARLLGAYAGRPGVLVLALPRGGVPVGYEVARALGAPLDVFVVRKLGVPGHEELAMGAIASGGVVIMSPDIVESYGVTDAQLDAVTEAERRELERRERRYRGDRPAPGIAGRTVILVDDGLATGSTMRAAVAALRQERPAEIIVAVPVAASETCELLRAEVDSVVCSATPEPFYAVGLWYDDFSQTTDDEVHLLLDRAAAAVPASGGGSTRAVPRGE